MRRLFFLLSVLACAGMAVSSAAAQQCTASVQNKVGDQIFVSATLTTSDPNENGEGEPLLLSSNAGDFSTVVGTYGGASSFNYTATADNETIHGFIAGFDGDEQCFIGTGVNPASGFTKSQKDAANKVTLGGAILTVGIGAVVAALGCTFTGGALCVALIVGGAATGGGTAVSAFIAGDPPDSNFMVIAEPSIPVIPPLVATGDLTADEATAFNALYANEAAVMGIGRAALISANRAQGAHLAGNSFWEIRQTQAVQLYATQLGALYAAEPSILQELHDALVAAGVSVTFSPFDVLNYESQIAFNGLPPSTVQALKLFDASPAELNQLRQLLLVQDIFTTAGTFPDILVSPSLTSALKQAGAAFSGVGIQIKPGSAAPAPINPRSNGAIPVAILGSSTFAVATINTATVRFGPSGALAQHSSVEDVNDDGIPDLVLQFRNQDAGIQCGAQAAVVTGKTLDKQFFGGGEPIVTVGCK